MAYDSNNKRLYVDSANGKGISLTEVAECLQDYRVNSRGQRDVGMLCTSPNINKWNKNKPFIVANGVNERIPQDADARRLAAYGFYWWNISPETQAPFGRSAEECLNKAIANAGEWLYKRPTSIFRVRDFDGYTRNAKRPYQYSIASPDLNQNNSCRVVLDPGDTDVEITLSSMPDFMGDFSGSVEDLNIVLIYRMKNGTQTRVEFTPFTVGQLDDGLTLSPHTLTFNPLNGVVSREWYILFAATNAQSEGDSDDIFYLYLPESLMVVNQREGLTWNYTSVFIYGENYFGIVPTDDSGNVLRGEDDIASSLFLGIEFKSQFDNTINYELRVIAWNADLGETASEAQEIHYQSGLITAGGSLPLEDAGSSLEVYLNDLNEPRLGSTKIAVNFSYKDIKNTGFIHRHLDLINGGIVANEAQDGVTLYELINSVPNMTQPVITE